MTQLLNLSLNECNKFIVVDEGINATYGKHLIIAWLLALRKKKIDNPIDILLFSTPKYSLTKYLQSSGLTNFEVQDYFNLNIDDDDVDVHEQLKSFVAQRTNSILVIDCLGTLALQIGPANTCRFVEKLSKNHKFEVFCIHRRDFYQVIPRVESLGNVYVKLEKSEQVSFGSNIYYKISVTQRKTRGSIVRWSEMVQQNIENCVLRSDSIVDFKFPDSSGEATKTTKSQEGAAKPQASFRLDMSEAEIRQRDSVPLPYILSDNPEKESKIFYVPDDFDEEDPDDDLEI
ncbi:PREDICTED: elongator complex protein 5 [Ceratosolen solmsi marchali]|uniref:Elongator complex protein 5 n=1 Tax=Ceratosolen solmsi marchali TaxID=326594 RepID=A0AAJ6YQ08_9HYME|nr:PREDICTED: elongator complex protein 5 [Ceratosolen solmsi marchali]